MAATSPQNLQRVIHESDGEFCYWRDLLLPSVLCRINIHIKTVEHIPDFASLYYAVELGKKASTYTKIHHESYQVKYNGALNDTKYLDSRTKYIEKVSQVFS